MILTVAPPVPHLGVSVRLLVVPVGTVDVVRPVVIRLNSPLPLATLGTGVSLGAVGMFAVDPGERIAG